MRASTASRDDRIELRATKEEKRLVAAAAAAWHWPASSV